jgi:hypothetical protein
LAKTAVRFALPLGAMVAGLAAKLVIVGAGITVTVAVCVTAVPCVGVTVSVYVVVVVGLTLTGVPFVTARLPGVIMPVPPENTAVRFELVPIAIVAALAVKLVIVGAGITVTVAVCVIAVPADGVTVSV